MTRRPVAPPGGRLLCYSLAPGEIIPEASHEHGHAVALLSGALCLHHPDGTAAWLESVGAQVVINPFEPHAWEAGPDGVVFWCYSWHESGEAWSPDDVLRREG